MSNISESELDNMVEEIKEHNFQFCSMLKIIAESMSLCLTLEEFSTLNCIARNAAERTIKERIFPRNTSEDDLRKLIPDIEIPRSIWKNNLMNKFCKVE